MGEQQSRNIMDYDTVRLDDENNAVVIIDQTKLPGKIEITPPLKPARIVIAVKIIFQTKSRGLALPVSMALAIS